MFNEQDEKSLEQELSDNQVQNEDNVEINVTKTKKDFNDFKIKHKRDKK